MNKAKVIVGIKLVSNTLCKIVKSLDKNDWKALENYSSTVTEAVETITKTGIMNKMAGPLEQMMEKLNTLIKE